MTSPQYMSETLKNTLFDLSGKYALITGAAGLLGIQHSIALVQSGAKVIMSDIDSNLLLNSSQKVFDQTGILPEIIVLDVTKKNAVCKINSDLKKNGKFVSILINNAAINPKYENKKSFNEASRLENFDINLWNIEMSVGLTGAILCSSEFGSSMAKNGGGVILNISSDLSVISPDQRIYKSKGLSNKDQPVKPVSYSVIKAGLIGLTRYLSTYWATSNVRCNALSPAGVYTSQDDEFVKRLSNLIPLGRMARNDEYRGAIQFMCSDASKYLNGQNIVIDGGRSVL